jgi:hypothetical protein
MEFPHGFEFMDLEGLPQSLRGTLRDILECGNSQPFRGYYDWVAERVASVARERGCTRIVELGAGTAPITRILAASIERGDVELPGCTLSPCDLNPDHAAYRQLEATYRGLVRPEYESVDFSRPRGRWPKGTLVFLSATLHHIPVQDRATVVQGLAQSADSVLVFEPLRKTVLSGLFCCLSLFPALLCPLIYFNRPERWRRFLWCWLIPAAPLMFVWDGLVSCARQWSRQEWLARLSGERAAAVEETVFCQAILLNVASRAGNELPQFEVAALAG